MHRTKPFPLRHIPAKSDIARKALEDGCDLYERGEYRRAAKCFLAGAKGGSVEARVNLANLYDCGKGVRKSFYKAACWYKRAVRGGCCFGASGLASSYRDRGQIRWAVYWFRKAVLMGDDWAQEDLNELLDGPKRFRAPRNEPPRPTRGRRPSRARCG